MDEKILKWLLGLLSNHELVNVVNNGGIKIAGFRKLTPKTIGKARLKVIAEISKKMDLERLTKVFYEMADDSKAILKLTFSEAKEKLLKGELEPMATIGAFFHSQKTDHRRIAYELFKSLKAEKLTELQEQYMSQHEEPEAEGEPSKNEGCLNNVDIIDALNKKLAKSEAKNQDLKKRLEESRKDQQQAKIESEEQIKSLKQEIVRLEQENRRIQHQANALKKEKRELAVENEKLKNRLSGSIEELEKWKEAAASSDRVRDHVEQKTARQVVIIGDPKNPGILKTPDYHFTIYDISDLKTMNSQQLEQVDEVWLLTYRTPIGQQQLVKRMVHSQKLLEFKDYLALKNYIKRGADQ